MARYLYLKRIGTLGISVAALSFLVGCSYVLPSPPSQATQNSPVTSSTLPNPLVEQMATTKFNPPLSEALQRVTLKTFGLYISPSHSPVIPERFTGYHTGVDFETYPSEQNTPLNVIAICTGKLLQKSWVAGYGGVAVQACNLEGKAITVVYGHLKLASIATKVGEELQAGATWAELGKGYSTETDGERKHLHLGIHRGTGINIRGYVQKPTDLSQWVDVTTYLK